MLEYILFSVLVISLIFYYYISGIELIKYALLLVLILFLGLRHYVGTDFPAYVDSFKSIDLGLVKFQGKEIGFTYINYMLKFFFGLNYQSVFLFCSFITIAFISSTLSSFNSRFIYAFGLFLYVFSGFYTQSFNIVRQAMSMAIAIYSLRYVNERKFFSFYFFVVLSMLFHTTSVVFLPLYYIYRIKLSRKFLYGILAFAFIVKSYIFSALIYILNLLNLRYIYFLNPGEDNVTSGTGLMQYVTLIMLLVAILYIDKIENKYLIYFKVFYLYVLFNLVFFDFMLGIRAIQGYKLSMIILLPYLFSLLGKHSRYLIVLLCIVYYLGFWKFIAGSSNVIPYSINLNF
ncbi:EpsG family protein [Vibrio ulleungensis]|uniref:EpsG family protein n=1 Tax=Vibrio ulleungensis TaxID=2807619 RepID=A0ABS2HJK8_9VIBR|nr:EpsG family protein [Vibrio ulleungensis]